MLLLFPANILYSKYDKSRHVPQRTFHSDKITKFNSSQKTMLGICIYVKSFKYLDKVTVFTIQIARTFICIFFLLEGNTSLLIREGNLLCIIGMSGVPRNVDRSN